MYKVKLREQEQLKKSTEDEALRTLEEELADLEELWPDKPFELRESILKVLIKRVIIDPLSTKFFSVTVEWRYQEWGTEQTYLMQEDGGRREWTKQEIEVLKSVYPGEKERFPIMQALPNRSWRGIRAMATNLGLNAGNGQGKGKGIRYQRNQLESLELSWNDILWLQKSALTFKNFLLNEVGWTSSWL